MSKKNIIYLILASVLYLHVIPGSAQNINKPESEEEAYKKKCGEYLSAYRTFFTLDLYDYAMIKWIQAFDECPASSERMYIDGVTMYRSFIQNTPEGPARETRIDSLMLIYDRRMENFGGEGNILGRKGRDLLTYRGKDIDQVEKAYQMLKRSVELERSKAQESVMLLFISAGITLSQEGKMEVSQLFDDYFQLSGMLDEADGRSSRIKRSRQKVNDLMLSKNMLTCEALDSYFQDKVKDSEDDVSFQRSITRTYRLAVCELSEIFIQAEENLYKLEPGPESAYELGMAFVLRKEYNKALSYLEEAIQGSTLNAGTLSEWNYDLAKVLMELTDYCGAIAYAREAITLNKDLGKAYLLLGNAFINARGNLGDAFQQASAYWAAADMYSRAASTDPSLATEVQDKLTEIKSLYPSKEDVFFRDLKVGDSIQVGGCINETTSVK